MTIASASHGPGLDWSPDGADLRLGIAGEWTLARGMPSIERVARAIGDVAPRRLVFDDRGLADWDSALVTFAYAVADLAAEARIELDLGGIPSGARKLLAIATAVPPRPLTRPAPTMR
jgi:phospholipid/cholesterol/gamma-HCH transport system permease protein